MDAVEREEVVTEAGELPGVCWYLAEYCWYAFNQCVAALGKVHPKRDIQVLLLAHNGNWNATEVSVCHHSQGRSSIASAKCD